MDSVHTIFLAFGVSDRQCGILQTIRNICAGGKVNVIIEIVPVSEQRKHLCIVLFKRKAFLNVLLERFSRPLAESSRFLGIDPVADCNNGIEVVMLCR